MKKDKELTAFNVRDIPKDTWEKFKTVSQVLGYETLNESAFYGALGRLSNVEVGAIDQNIFRPYEISMNVRRAFVENAQKLGLPDPLEGAWGAIGNIQNQLSGLSLTLGKFPDFPNPIATRTETGEQVAPPLSLNLPNVETQTLAAMGQGNQYSNLTTQQKLDLLFPQG